MKVGLYVTFVLSLFLFENCTSWPAMILALFGGGGKGGSMILLPPGGSESPTGSGNLGNQNNTGNQPSNPNNPSPTPPNVEFASASSNGLENVSPASITVQLSSAYTSDITVDYSVTGGTATGSGTDFTLNNGTLTFPAGTTTQTISLSLVDDNLPETNETIVITLANPSNGASLGANNTHTFTIIDDDSPNVSFASATSSGSENVTTVTIPVNLSMSSPLTITVDYAVTGGTATGGGVDYTLASGTLTFNPGDLTKNITFTVVNDTLYENDETVQITLSNQTNSNLGLTTTHTYTIENDDSMPQVAFSISNSNGLESVTTVNIAVVLNTASGLPVTVDYSATGGTATGGGVDYTLNSGTLTFAPGQTTKTISATIVNDSLNEANETFSITLNNPSNVTLGTNQTHTYTILDDDPQPTIQFASASSSTPDESATNRTVQITLSAVSGQNVSVTVSMTGGSATPGTDFTNPFPVTATITAGNTSTTVTIPILADLIVEGNETINLQLSSPTNATLGGVVNHTFTITDDDVGIVSAETLDANGDGQIDHYKITFTEAVNDSSFPGYVANSLGNSQTDWLVAGYSGVVLAHGTAAPETDTVNDAIIYLKFTQSGSADTDAKPDLTTTTSPTLVTMSSKTVGIVYTASVTEADRAKPVIISATTNTATNVLTVTFSEPVWGSAGMPACGSGGQLTVSGFTYNNVSGSGVSSLTGMGSDTCGTDEVVTLTANTNFTAGDHNIDTLALTSNVYDGANNTGNTTAKAISVTIGPVITSAEIFDTDKNGKIDQIKLTFNVNMQDSTIDDADAALFTYGGTALTKVDTATSGTGVITTPNNDPGVANDNIVTVFTNNFTVNGTDPKTLSFTQSTGRWQGNSIDLQTIASISVTDKAPPVILTAVAYENANPVAGVDSDDTLVLTFSEPTNKPNINNGNISSIFSTTPAHSWGTITSATWNTAGDQLTILFAGVGTTVSVGDYVNILGTITDADGNESINIPSVNPISGNFNVTPPLVSSASSLSPTSVRVTFTQPVNNTQAQTITNYKIAISSSVTGTCSDNTNFSGSAGVLTISSITKVDDYTYDLTTSSQTNGVSYALLVNKPGISHKDYAGYTVQCPNTANFVGQEVIRIASVSCNTLNTVVITFSKNVKTGVNTAGSAECNTKVECDKRYVIKGVVSGVEIGDLQSAYVLDGTVCGGLPANPSKVCLTHSLYQSGSIYTLIAANNTNGDGFDDTSFGAIKDSTNTENLQASPKDRGSFAGCGTVPHNFVEGPIISDPFGDGTAFGYLNKYGGKVYIGPNKNGNGATRFNADGSFPENLTFELPKDTFTGSGTGTRTSASTASAPFASIGFTGCTTNSAGPMGCGPDNQDGRGLFASGTFSGVEYLFLGGAKTSGNNDYLYFTQDLDSILNFSYMDANQVFHNYDSGTCPADNSSSVSQNMVTESIHIFNGAIYWSVPGDGTNRPFAVKINNLVNDVNCNAGQGDYFNMRYMTGVGRLANDNPAQYDPTTNTPMQAQPDILGGIFHSFNNRVYFANSGSISYRKNSNPALRCIEGDTYNAGVCEQTGGIVRSVNNNPGKCTRSGGVNYCPDWVNITPSSLDYRKYFSIGLEDNKDLIPAQRPIPAFEEFNGNYYFIRNACLQALWDDGSINGGDSNNGCGFNTSCGNPPEKNDKLCPDSDRVPQLWKCVPGGDGHCDPGDWSLVAQNGSTGKTNFGDNNNKKITLLARNGSYLYVGFDNAVTGIEIWRTNVANPSSESDFTQIGGDGFGSGTNITEIYSSISLQNGSIHYLYLSVGKNSFPVRVYRQQNN